MARRGADSRLAPSDKAVGGIGSADKKRMPVVADHDSKMLAHKTLVLGQLAADRSIFAQFMAVYDARDDAASAVTSPPT